MITRKIDSADERVGFASDWVAKIAQHVQRLTVITWQLSQPKGLPKNVELVSLPQNLLLKIAALKWQLLRRLGGVDGVFCHMNPEYTILAAPLARLFGKRVVSWYTHGTVSLRAKMMEKLTHVVLTASAESFRLPSKKVQVTGHGIDIEQFKPADRQPSAELKLLTVGRISPTKDYESMIKALDVLRDAGDTQVRLDIIGAPGLAEHAGYLENLKKMASAMGLADRVTFVGALPHAQIPSRLQSADVFINLSGTGSVDKAVLEAMACGCIVLTSNEAFKSMLPKELMIEQNNPEALAAKIRPFIQLSNAEIDALRQRLRQIVVERHNLNQLAVTIVNQFLV